jgi:hypothetical protein
MRVKQAITLVCLAMVPCLLPPIASGATIVVDSLADPGVPGDGLTTLREAIAAANADTASDSGGAGEGADTIDLSGLSGTIALSGPLPEVTAALTLLGPPDRSVIVSGQQAHAFLANAADPLRLESLVFEDSYTCGLPFGAIRNSGRLEILGCEMRRARGAMASLLMNETGATLDIRGTLFSENETSPLIHAIGWVDNSGRYANAGAVLYNDGDAYMQDCEVSENQCMGGILRNRGRLTAERCRFLRNGGKNFYRDTLAGVEPLDDRYQGIALGPVIKSDPGAGGTAGELRIRDCHFEDNASPGIDTDSLLLEVVRSSFVDNYGAVMHSRAKTNFIANSTFYGNHSGWWGDNLVRQRPLEMGGSVTLNGDIWLLHCTVFNTTFATGQGAYHDYAYPATVHVYNNLYQNCLQPDYSGSPLAQHPVHNPQIFAPYCGGEIKDDLYDLPDIAAMYAAALATAPNGTKYLPLLPCSPARGAGDGLVPEHPDFPGALDTDQTGAPRSGGEAADYGAHQASGTCVPASAGSDAVCAPPNPAAHPGLIVNSLADPGKPDDGWVTLREAMLAYYTRGATDLGQSAATAAYIDLTCLSGRIELSAALPGIYRSITIRGPQDQSLVITTGRSAMHSIFGAGQDETGPLAPSTIRIEDLVFEDIQSQLGAVGNLWAFPEGYTEFHRCRFVRCNRVHVGPNAAFYDSAIIDCEDPIGQVNNLVFVQSAYRGNRGTVRVYGKARIELSVFDSNLATPLKLYTHGPANQPSAITRSLFINNQGADAGALAMRGNIDVTNCTFSGNRCFGGYFDEEVVFRAYTSGGAINALPDWGHDDYGVSTIKITHCTIVGNQSAFDGGGILNMDPVDAGYQPDTQRVILRNSIVAGNAARLDGPDIGGGIISQGYNILGNAAGADGLDASDSTGHAPETIVSPLLDNGGPHRTHAVLSCGPAFDFCASVAGIAVDELGNPRNRGCRPDAGAFELNVASCAPVDSEGCPDGGPYPAPVFSGPYRGLEAYPDTNECEIDFPLEPEGWEEVEGELGGGEGEAHEEFPYEGDWQDDLVEGEFDTGEYVAGQQNILRKYVSLVLGQWLGRFHYGGGGNFDTPAPDLDRDGRLSQMESFASMVYLHNHPDVARDFPDLLRYRTAIFNTFDLDKNGYVRTAELNYWVTRLGFPVMMHAADANGDFRFGLSELLRIVQFYNIGGLGCGELEDFADDGFQADADRPSTPWCTASHGAGPHGSDFDGDYRISLQELLRAIQLFNGKYLINANYAPCAGTEDYHCDPDFWTEHNVLRYVPRQGRSLDDIL